jgi:hypothetical protein
MHMRAREDIQAEEDASFLNAVTVTMSGNPAAPVFELSSNPYPPLEAIKNRRFGIVKKRTWSEFFKSTWKRILSWFQ